MKNLLIIISLCVISGCTDKNKRLECSNSFATICIMQEDCSKYLDKRKDFKELNNIQHKIISKTTELLTYLDNYESNLFSTLNIEKPVNYSVDWCMDLECNNNYKLLTDKLIGEPCSLITGKFTLMDLYSHITKYNILMDNISNTNYCKDNISFDSISDPEKDNCIYTSDRFYNMSLNNHLIGLYRIKEAILNQEEMLIEKNKTLPNIVY